MGRLASGTGLATFLGASVGFLWAATAFAQVPAPPGSSHPPANGPGASEALPPVPPPPPAAQPTSTPPSPAVPARPSPPPAAPAPAAPPLLDPPASQPAPSRPAFLHTAEEMDRLKPLPQRRPRPPSEPSLEGPPPKTKVPPDFVLRSSPWVDFSLTSFQLEDRTGNFLNLGVQFGGYLFERLRVAGRIVTPLEDVGDGYSSYNGTPFNGSQSFTRVKARSMSMLYSASVGLLITNSRTFAFAPSVEFARTDVGAYGSAFLLGLPFEWTTLRNLRVGFEFALGHSFGGNLKEACRTVSTPQVACGVRTTDRPSGTAVLVQYYMGWSLGAL